jgi:cyclophilin family peptidyl-prolyl cis-trans isomerase
MRVYFSTSVCLFAMAVLLAFGGCGKSGTEASNTTASIPGTEQSTDGNANKPSVPQTPHEVVLDTNKGSITISLNAEKSPKTVANFLTYVKDHFYDGTIFHQVYKNQAVFGGGYTEDMTAKPTRIPIYNEARNGLKNERYTVAMLREPDDSESATSVFFINVVDNPSLDYTASTHEKFGYCVFGQIIQGKEIVDQIASVDVQDTENIPCMPKQNVVIKSAKQIK